MLIVVGDNYSQSQDLRSPGTRADSLTKKKAATEIVVMGLLAANLIMQTS